MSSMAALALFSAAALPAPPVTITADEAMANYRTLIHGADHDRPGARVDCARATGDQIVVCASRAKQTMRLPLRDERAEPGEVVRHLGESAGGDPGPPTGPPSKQMQTLGKIFGLLRGAVTGEDPDD
jgi:hypothetical protein